MQYKPLKQREWYDSKAKVYLTKKMLDHYQETQPDLYELLLESTGLWGKTPEDKIIDGGWHHPVVARFIDDIEKETEEVAKPEPQAATSQAEESQAEGSSSDNEGSESEKEEEEEEEEEAPVVDGRDTWGKDEWKSCADANGRCLQQKAEELHTAKETIKEKEEELETAEQDAEYWKNKYEALEEKYYTLKRTHEGERKQA